jgi:hypothetical protein|tara:strand:- start:1181 stop:1579 length:399 start_codon:yes stop_codon:yes gene_type:complete
MFKIELDDEAIMDMEKEDEKVTQYRRYIMSRFMVMEREDDKIFVADKEIGVTRELETGDSLADGSVEIKEEGVVFQPPRADQQPFVIPSREEFMPMASFKADKDRIKLDDKLEERHNNEMIILMVEDSDRLR